MSFIKTRSSARQASGSIPVPVVEMNSECTELPSKAGCSSSMENRRITRSVTLTNNKRKLATESVATEFANCTTLKKPKVKEKLAKKEQSLFQDDFAGDEKSVDEVVFSSTYSPLLQESDYKSDDLEGATLLAEDLALCGGGTWPLFNAAMKLVKISAVSYRSVKANLVGCSDDTEYIAKLHCLRGAFTRIMNDIDKREDICIKGKSVFSTILVKAEKDPKDFETKYDALINWSQEPSNWGALETELKDRGLGALTFYDIVLDFIFLDAFEDLEAPPASCLAVIQNRWLSTSFKKTALCAAVWSVLKTKRRWLRSQDGFIAHFYDVSEYIMPTLAWGFLGPPCPFQKLCYYFKDKFKEFLQAIFSFEKVRYTTVEELCVDILARQDKMYADVMERLNSSLI